MADRSEPGRRRWYAGYGSNLRATRMATYLEGGLAAGSRRTNPGSRDRARPVTTRTCEVQGRLRFEGRSKVWGDGGGAAFFERSDDPDDRVVWRAYLNTVNQLVDLVLQENGVDPRALDPATLRRLEDRVAGLPSDRPATIDLGPFELRPYDLLEWMPATGRPAGDRLQVALLGRSTPQPEVAPPAAYHDVIRQGLVEDAGLAPADAEGYLDGFLPDRPDASA
jgi:hypothetical protein